MKQKSSGVTERIVSERLALLKADPEFKTLKKLLLQKLKGKEAGKVFEGITTDSEIYKRRKEDKRDILLSETEWKRYQEFCTLCEKLANKYRLHWVTVEDLAMGVRQPTVPSRPSEIIKAYLDPIVIRPRDFKTNTRYASNVTFVPPLETIEIMRRLQGLDEQTKAEIKAYLEWLLKDKPGCRILELENAEGSKENSKDEVRIDVCMKIPIGYNAKEVAEVYRKADSSRRDILAALGASVPKRRRSSKILSDAERLRLFEADVNIYDIVDEVYPADDLSKDQIHKRSIILRRSKGRQQLKKRYFH